MSFGGGGAGASLGSAEGHIIISTSEAERNIKQLQNQIGGFADSSSAAFNRIATGVGLLAFSAGVGKLFTGALGGAADFEQGIANINAVAGLTAEQLEAVRQKALQLGKDTVFSATEAAGAMEELAKAGVSVDDILGGAADGAVALAAAAGTSLPEAAALISTALNQFQEGGDQATRFADLFAAAAGASNASATEIGRGFAYAGGQAHLLGISAEDLATSLAILSDAGLGERAGTSLNQALSSLAAPTDLAQAALEQLGVSAFDAAGNFKPLPDLIQDLATATAGMTTQAKEALLSDIFGEQGMRAILPLIQSQTDAADAAGKGWEQYEADVTKAGAAQEQARKRMDTFRGSLEQMRGSLETVAITVGSLVLPALRELVDGVTGVLNVFLQLPTAVQGLAAGLVGVAGAVSGIAGVMVLAGPRAAAFGEALRTIRIALLGINPLLLALVAGIALFGAAYKTNFGGFADFVDGVGAKVKGFADVFARSFKFSRSLPDIGNAGAAFAALGQAMTEALGIDVYKQFRKIGKVADRFGTSLNRMGKQFEVLSNAFKRGGLAAGIDRLFGDVGQKLVAEFGDAIAALPRTVGTALRQISTGIDPLDKLFKNLGSAFIQFGRVVENVFAGDFATAWENAKNTFERIVSAGIDLGSIAVSIGGWLIDAAQDLWAAILTKIAEWLGIETMSRVRAPGDPVNERRPIPLGTVKVQILDWAIETLSDLWKKVRTYVTEDLWPTVKGTAIDVADAAISIVSWGVQAATSIWEAVSSAVDAAWRLVKGLAVDLPEVALNVVAWTIRAGAGIWDAVSGTVGAAWELVKDTAIDIKDVALNVLSWVTDQLDSGTLVSTVQGFIETQLATINVTMNDWTLTVGAPSDDQITIDTAAIFGAIWDALTTPLTVDPETAERARTAGHDLGEKAVDLIVGALHDFFVPGGDAESQSEEIGIDAVVTAFFGGLLGGLNDAIDAAMTAWLGEPSDVPAKILGKLKQIFVDPFTNMGGPQSDFLQTVRGAVTGVVNAIKGLFGSGPSLNTVTPGTGILTTNEPFWQDLVDALKLPDIPTPSLPAWLSNTSWLTGPLGTLTNAISKATAPLKKAWDLYESIKDLFASESAGNEPLPVPGVEPGLVPGDEDQNGIPDILDTPENFLDPGRDAADSFATGFGERLGPKLQATIDALNLTPPKLPGGGALGAAGGALAGFGKGATLPAPDIKPLADALEAAKSNTVAAVAGIEAVLGGMAAPLGVAGQTAGTSFALGVGAGMNLAIQAAQRGASAIRSAAAAIGSIAGIGFSVGQSLGYGIASGITSTIGAVTNAVAGLINAARQTAVTLAQIGSPSRLFAADVGIPIAQGIAAGITAGAPSAQRSIADLIGGLIPSGTRATQMLGSQPVAVGGGAVTYITNVYPLKSDEYQQIIRNGQRGAEAHEFVGQIINGSPDRLRSTTGRYR